MQRASKDARRRKYWYKVLRSPRALTFGYGCTVRVGVGVGAGDAEVDVNLYNIHHEHPVHIVLGTVQRQGTNGQLDN